MKKVVLIGLGDIGKHHSQGLRHSAILELVAVCDIDPNAPSRCTYADIPYYDQVETMLDEWHPDMAIVATPPSTHASLVSICHSREVMALVEKPIAATREEAGNMLGLLVDNKMDIIYHWMFSQEVLWFKRSIRIFGMKSIHVRVEDPYTDRNGHVKPSRRFMGGCWMDSGVNALSMISLWVDLATMRLKEIAYEKDGEILVVTHALFISGEVEVEIDLNWTTGRNFKETTMLIGDDKYVLHHSEQKVSRNGEVIFSDQSMDRLDRHYYNFYCLYPSSLITKNTSILIHKILFDNIPQ